jgi:hypothetical protein
MAGEPADVATSERHVRFAMKAHVVERFSVTYRSSDEYDRIAITHVMKCASRFPGELLRGA